MSTLLLPSFSFVQGGVFEIVEDFEKYRKQWNRKNDRRHSILVRSDKRLSANKDFADQTPLCPSPRRVSVDLQFFTPFPTTASRLIGIVVAKSGVSIFLFADILILTNRDFFSCFLNGLDVREAIL